MKQMKHAMKPLAGLVAISSLLALAACGEQQQQQQQAAAPAESEVEKETIVWKLAQTWGTGFPIFGDAVINMADMVKAGKNAGVGPMAAVAGAIAEHVGLGLLKSTNHVIVENGGDIFIKTDAPLTVGIFAGKSSLSLRIGIRLSGGPKPMAVCTSSGTVGHSLSLGRADAVCVAADSCAIADAAATAIGVPSASGWMSLFAPKRRLRPAARRIPAIPRLMQPSPPPVPS